MTSRSVQAGCDSCSRPIRHVLALSSAIHNGADTYVWTAQLTRACLVTRDGSPPRNQIFSATVHASTQQVSKASYVFTSHDDTTPSTIAFLSRRRRRRRMWLILCRVLKPQLLRSKPIGILLLCEPVRLSCGLHRQPWGRIHRRGTCLCPPTKTIANRCQTCRLSAVPVQLSLAKQLLLFAR